MNPITLSVIIPVLNEEQSLRPLVDLLIPVLRSMIQLNDWEVIFVDDGSTDRTLHILRTMQNRESKIKVVSLRRQFGKSAALSAGFEASNGDVLVTIDGDLQDDPREIPNLVNLLSQGYDLVSGWKKDRRDPLEKRIPSKLFNFIVSRITRVKLHDFNCGLKAYRRWCVDDLKLTGNLYRYLPALVAHQGGRVTEIAVRHHPRKYGKSKYGWLRYFEGLADLLTVIFLTKFTEKPLYLFAILGSPLLVFGGGIGFYLLMGHLHYLVTGSATFQLVSRPLLDICITLFGLGLQIVLFGLLAELVVNLRGKKSYYIRQAELDPVSLGKDTKQALIYKEGLNDAKKISA